MVTIPHLLPAGKKPFLQRASCLLLVVFVFAVFPGRAQEAALPGGSSPSQAADLKRGNTWTIGTSYGNNSSFLGRNQSIRLPFLSADLTYAHKGGWWLSTMAYQVLHSSSYIDEVDVMAGWDYQLSEKLDASVSYSRFFFSPQSELIKATTANSFSSQAGLDWRYLYSRLNFTYIFGGASDVFLILDNSRYFQLEKVLHPAGILSIEPKFSLIAGTQTFAETHLVSRRSATSPVSSPIFGKPGMGKPGASSGSGSTGGASTATTTSFNLLNYEGSIPVTYSLGSLALEVSLRYSVPVNLLEGDASKPRFFCVTSLYYTIR